MEKNEMTKASDASDCYDVIIVVGPAGAARLSTA